MISSSAAHGAPPPVPLENGGSTTTLPAASAENVTGEEKNHVLMVSFSSQGHINPMLRLGKHLISKGLHVTLAATEVTRQRMLKSATISDDGSTPSGFGVDLVFFSDGMSLDYNRAANLDHFIETLGKAGPINISALIKERYPEGGKRKLLCLIANPFVPWVADVAAEHGIPCALLWIQPCALYWIYYNFSNKSSEFPSEADPNKTVELPGLPQLTTQDLPSFVLPTNSFNRLSNLILGGFKILEKFKWVMVNSFYELEKSVIESVSSELCRIQPVGPLVPPSLLGQDEDQSCGVEMWKSDDSCVEWLDRQEPCSVVYVSFGSIVTLPATQMEGLATALKNAGRPFLWVVKLPESAAATGVGQLPVGFLEETKGQGLIVPWSPQTRVLAHPAIACFVTHCGWNSMLEAISSGVPLIAYPQWTDQPTNAKLITDVFKIGVKLVKDESGIITSSEIEKRIEEVMDGEKPGELRKNAEEMKRAARESLAPGGSSDETIQRFVDEVISGKYGDNEATVASENCFDRVEKQKPEEETREDEEEDKATDESKPSTSCE